MSERTKAENKACSAKQLVQRMKCRVGLHDWSSKGANVLDQDDRTITLIWWECEACAETRLKFIFGNWSQPEARQ